MPMIYGAWTFGGGDQELQQIYQTDIVNRGEEVV